MLCSVAAILIYAAAVGEMDDDPMDEGGFFAPMMVNLPTYTPTASSYVAPIVSSSSHVTGPKVAHRSFSSQLSDGVGAASGISAGSSMSYGGGWSSGVHITQVATGGPGGDGYGGGGGGGTGSSSSSGSSTHNYASVHIPMLNLGNGTFTTVASGIGHGKGPHLAGETADGGLYTGDAPGEITGTETQNLDNPIVNSYGQPIGDALLPLLILALLFGGCIWRRERQIKPRDIVDDILMELRAE